MSEKQFLPLCDLLFNLISLACYFCDIVFDLTMGYALYQKGQYFWSFLIVSFVLFSLVVCQFLSIFWYLKQKKKPNEIFCLLLIHGLSMGVIWRHFKLLLPVDLSWIKSEMRDICVLRLIHGFLNSGPTLLVQLHLYLNYKMDELKDLSALSVCLSIFSICWALSSYSKNLKRRNMHRLVLTWPGVITQFMWRLGTVGTRAVCLVLYASLYGPWVLVVVLLHWISMFLWIVSTELLAVDQPKKTLSRTWTSALVAFVYILAYINVQDGKHTHKMIVYYVVMTLENALLCFSWYLNAPKTSANEAMPFFLICAYLCGIFFMLIYYRFFHVRRLKYNMESSPTVSNEGTTESSVATETIEKKETKQEPPRSTNKPRYSRYYSGAHHHNGIPGVFNCRFTNPYSAAVSKRKKKKPTSFVPPPSILPSQHCPVPFWCRPLVSEEKVARSPVDIRAKLEEKKRQQLAELRDIEEEILRNSNYPQELALSYIRTVKPETVPYTLPRQSRYFKRYRKPAKPARYCPPANSSDGDVDSLDDNETDDKHGGCWYTATQHRLRHNPRVRHETKL